MKYHETKNYNAVQIAFAERYPDRAAPCEWPPKSPDLTSCDFFMGGGYLRNKVFATPPDNTKLERKNNTGNKHS